MTQSHLLALLDPLSPTWDKHLVIGAVNRVTPIPPINGPTAAAEGRLTDLPADRLI